MVTLFRKHKMKNPFNISIIQVLWRHLRPWAIFAIVFVVLRVTGALSGVTYFTSSALMKTGILDAATAPTAAAKTFDYNFNIKDLEGQVIDFNRFKGKTIFLNMWATWCGPCRVEMPAIDELYKKVKDNDKIVFVMLSIDKSENFTKVVDFTREKGFAFPVYVPSGHLPKQLQVPMIPTTLVVNSDGKIVSKETGTTNYDTPKFKEFLESL